MPALGNVPFVAGAKAPERESLEVRRRKIAEAKAFLKCALAERVRPASEVLREAGRAGIAERTLYHAKAALGVASTRQGYYGGRWVWALPGVAVGANR